MTGPAGSFNKDKDKDIHELRYNVIWVTGHSGGFNSPSGREFSESASDHQDVVDSHDDDDDDGNDDDDGDAGDDNNDDAFNAFKSPIKAGKPLSGNHVYDYRSECVK